MSRPARIIFNGAIYHVYQRGNNKDYIFNSAYHKSFFIKQLKEYNKKFDYQLLGYVIMNNHYHILIRTNNDPINKIMFYINNVMGKFLARELGRTGHIFEGRYKCKLIDDDAYLLWVLRYIHRNPIRANICKCLSDYKWCSHYFYKNDKDDFVDIDFILQILCTNRHQAINKFLNLMDATEYNDDAEYDLEMIKQHFSLESISSSLNIQTKINGNYPDLNSILDSLQFSIDIEQLIKNASSTRVITPYKIQFIESALSYKYTLVEISEFLNVTPSSLSKFIAYHKIPH